jgi:hypothetical protein
MSTAKAVLYCIMNWQWTVNPCSLREVVIGNMPYTVTEIMFSVYVDNLIFIIVVSTNGFLLSRLFIFVFIKISSLNIKQELQ